jgi:diguanylate cyclase (GGDEF)-like protein
MKNYNDLEVKIKPKNNKIFKTFEKQLIANNLKNQALLEQFKKIKNEYDDLYNKYIFGRKYPQLYTASFFAQELKKALKKRFKANRRLEDKLIHGLVMIDLDDFKKVNDNYGHLNGDKILNKVCDVIKKYSIKEKAISCKYGGEEFIIWFKSVDLNLSKLKQKAKTLIQKINTETKKIKINKNWKGVTASAGCSITTSFHKENPTAIKLIEKADKQLLKAKKQGKNKVN